MQHVAVHMADGVLLEVSSLEGELVSRKAGQPPVFDDAGSYVLKLRAADVAMDAASVTHARRSNSTGREDLAAPRAAGHDEGRRARDTGKLHKGVWVPFSMTSAVSASNEGRIRLHATKLKTAGVPMKGLLDLLGLEVGELMKLPKDAGISADGDDLLLDAARLVPPPRMEGRVERVAVMASA